MPNVIINLLIAERDRLNRAIAALQGGAVPKRRSRPPKSPAASAPVAAAPARVSRRRKRTKAQREEQAARMKAYWAKRKKQEAKG